MEVSQIDDNKDFLEPAQSLVLMCLSCDEFAFPCTPVHSVLLV